MTDISEFRGKTRDELKDKAMELKKELFNLRFQRASGELANTGRFRVVRRDIARIKTAMNEEPKAAKVPAMKAAAPKKPAAEKPVAPKKPATKKKA